MSSKPSSASLAVVDSASVSASATASAVDSTYAGNLDSADRMRVLTALANNAGIRLPSTRIPEGESLLPIGEENKRSLQAEVKALPDMIDGVRALRARIVIEDHRDVAAPIQRVRMEPSRAGLMGPGMDKAIGYTHSGFSHVLSFVKPPSLRGSPEPTLLALPPRIRAEAFNYFAENAHRSGENEVYMRTMVDPGSGRRLIRAVTSEKHSKVTGDDVAILDAMESSIPAGAKLRVTRTLDRTDLEVIWPAMEREIRVGDTALIALSISNSETKAGALRVEPKLLRVLCYNFTTAWSEGGDEEITIRHVGDLRTKLPQAFAKALKVVEPFIRAFGDAYKVSLPSNLPTRGEVLARLGKTFAGILPVSTLDIAAQKWDADGDRSAGDTLAGLVNALTRASQEANMEAAQRIEKVSGQLIVKGWAALN